jgi:methionyl-tRNA formyltransferase
VAAFVGNAKPDLLWVTDYRYLLPRPLLDLAPIGNVNLHPSLLPKYRGRASINWAILNGETTLGLTAHFIDEGMDTGDIIDQVSFELRQNQDVGDALRMLYPLYEEITVRVLDYFRSGAVPRRRQDHSQATSFPRRKADDGEIDWRKSAIKIVNLVRAVAAPYPGAFTECDGNRLMVWQASVGNVARDASHSPGVVMAKRRDAVVVACKDGCVVVERIEALDPTQAVSIHVGTRFEVHA